MSNRWWLLALGLQLACSDTIIGSSLCEERDGYVCSRDDPYRKVRLPVHFTVVPTVDPAALPIEWRSESPCAQLPCATPIQLWRAGSDAVWTLPRDGAVGALSLLDASSNVLTKPIAQAPAGSGALQAFTLSSDASGRAVAHAQWSATDGVASGPDSIYVVPAAGFGGPTPTVVLGPSLFDQTRPRLPPGVLDTTTGFLFFDGTHFGGEDVSLFGPDGKRVFRTQAFPTIPRIGTSAAQWSDGYVLGAGTVDTGATTSRDYGILTLDGAGEFTRYASVDSSTWRSIRVQPWAPGDYAAAAQADVNLAGVLEGSGTGNIEVVTFTDQNAPRGYRIQRSCFNTLTLNGFTSDAHGTIYISSVAGTQLAPSGLLCRLPVQRPGGVDGIGQCWQAPPNELLWEISASDEGAIYAVMGPYDGTGSRAGDGIVRIELPPLLPAAP